MDQRAAQRPSVANLPPDEAAYAFQPASESPEFSLEDKLLMLLRLRGWPLVSTVRTLRPRMLRTMWFALSCLAVLGAMITIKVATTPAPLAVAATHDQTAIGIAFGPNTAAKSDRLPIQSRRRPIPFRRLRRRCLWRHRRVVSRQTTKQSTRQFARKSTQHPKRLRAGAGKIPTPS